jgi:uncharacterized membrane protein
MWIVYAFLSAIFAALTSILAKIGIEHVNLNCYGDSHSGSFILILGNCFRNRESY